MPARRLRPARPRAGPRHRGAAPRRAAPHGPRLGPRSARRRPAARPRAGPSRRDRHPRGAARRPRGAPPPVARGGHGALAPGAAAAVSHRACAAQPGRPQLLQRGPVRRAAWALAGLRPPRVRHPPARPVARSPPRGPGAPRHRRAAPHRRTRPPRGPRLVVVCGGDRAARRARRAQPRRRRPRPTGPRARGGAGELSPRRQLSRLVGHVLPCRERVWLQRTHRRPASVRPVHGADCADVLVGALRAAGRRDVAYTSVAGIGRLAMARSGVLRALPDGTLRGADGAAVALRWGDAVAPGDLVTLDYASDTGNLLPRAWDHIAALVSDANGDGVLDGGDLVRHMGPEGLVDTALVHAGPMRVVLWRWRATPTPRGDAARRPASADAARTRPRRAPAARAPGPRSARPRG
jgi:hypothetical protein